MGKTFVEGTELCPHCDNEIDFKVDNDTHTIVCSECGKQIVLCDKCALENPNAESRNCDKCIYCDLANYMNYLKGKCSIEKFLSSLNPPLTDMTSGLAEGQTSTYENFINDEYGDDVLWDVKYWDCYRMVKECFLNAESSEKDCFEFVKELVKKNEE